MYYQPNPLVQEDRDIVYVHPFAGEMAASRNVIAAMARELASRGLGVLTVDLFGCGDSSGDFRQARWEIWREDVASAVHWLQEQGRERISLWGLRLGALLALDFAANSGENYENIFLWQPVLSGESMMTQFFRMNHDEMTDTAGSARLISAQHRRALPPAETIEVAGYELSSELIRAIDGQNIEDSSCMFSDPICWTEIVSNPEFPFRAEARRILDERVNRGLEVSSHRLMGSPFWLFPHCVSPQRISQEAAPDFFCAATHE